MDKQREKLIELIKEAKKNEVFEALMADIDSAIDMPHGDEYLAYHLLANGVNVQPLKEGDKAYVLSLGNVEEFTICKSPYSREEATYHLPVEEGDGHICVFPVSWKDIGKTVFLSREDAEKALKGVEG